MTDQAATLYARLGGYDAIAAVADDLLPRLMSDPLLARYWANRAANSVRREKQLLIDFLCSSAGGPLYYTGRDMTTSHKGMGISAWDWDVFIGHVQATLNVRSPGPGTRGCSGVHRKPEGQYRRRVRARNLRSNTGGSRDGVIVWRALRGRAPWVSGRG